MTSPFPFLLCLLVGLLPLRAQDDFAKEDAALTKECVKTLTSFANQAKSKKVAQRAKQAFDLILEYDPDNATARRELDWTKTAGVWVNLPPEKRKKWRDKASYEDRFKIVELWANTAKSLSASHAKVGLRAQKEGNKERAKFHLEKAVYYNPMNEEANLALGHKAGEGFFGTDKQIAFARKMKEIEKRAVETARKQYPVEELPESAMPVELQNLVQNAPDWMLKPSFELHGAKTKNFEVWTRGSQENANESCMWGERAVEFVVSLLGEENAKKLQFVERATQSWKWQGFLATSREREEFLKANPSILRGRPVEEAMRFANNSWMSNGGPAVMKVGSSPRGIQDAIIAYVVMDGLCSQRNDGVGQGIIHAITWYMKSTSISRWGAIPEGTVGEDGLELPEGTNWWMRNVRDQAMSNQDWELAQVPREKLSRFRNDCRLKTWSMMTWMMAAYPDKWLSFFLKLPDVEKKVPTLEDVEAIVQEIFATSSQALDAEWREWARGDSGVAYATGYGPPLLPERPSDIEITALEQINLVRAQQIAYSWENGKDVREGTWGTLNECEMDAETSIGCDLHAKYCSNHPDLERNTDGKIHEEDPAHDDFTRQGQQAGGGNIVTSHGRATKAFARDSVDGWMSAPYHRFQMLEHNIKRLGYSHNDGEKLSVSVLDMGSLEEPYDPNTAPKLVIWPARDMTKVPTHFGNPEWPNPLEDQAENEKDVTKCGYAVSVQIQDETARQLGDCDIEIWESRKGRQPEQNMVADGSAEHRAWTDRAKEKVAAYVHTPKVPLNRKRDLRNVLFLIPKEPLESNKTYQVRAKLQIGGMSTMWLIWEFTTGSQKEGLKLK
ncbi:MAG: hypothetical protein H6835_08365 [Planctomycetes bacterium]|nr:hypothetical protein [Planctomycetota bacterium]